LRAEEVLLSTNNTGEDTLFEKFFGNIDYFLCCDTKRKKSIFSKIVIPNDLELSYVVRMGVTNTQTKSESISTILERFKEL